MSRPSEPDPRWPAALAGDAATLAELHADALLSIANEGDFDGLDAAAQALGERDLAFAFWWLLAEIAASRTASRDDGRDAP